MKERKDPPLFIILLTLLIGFIIFATILQGLQWLGAKFPVTFGIISWIVIGLGIYWWKYNDRDS